MKYPKRLSSTESELLEWADLFDLPETFAQAACKGKNPRIFDSNHPAAIAAARKVCGGCPIQSECLTWALKTGEEGFWGGRTADERKALSSKKQQTSLDELEERRSARERLLSEIALAELATEFQVTERTIMRWRKQIKREAS